MAYTKRTWLGRQGTGLNKFSIGGASPVTIVNQPDSVTQVGDALSAGNLNDLEDRIEDAFDDVDTALDTKADEQDVTNLNNALTALDHRVQNLEQSKGDYIVQSYKDGSIAPSGKGNWAVVEGLRGVSRVENQLAINGNFATGDMTGWTDVSSGTRVIADNKITYSWTVQYSNNGLANYASIIANHTYLICAKVKNLASESRAFRLGQTYGVQTESFSIASGATAIIYGVITPTIVEGNGYRFGFFGTQSGVSYSCEMTDFVVTDLTLYFNGSIPSDADTIAEIQQNYPHLLTPSDYGTRIVDSSYSGVRAWARNLFDKTQIKDTTYGTPTISGERISVTGTYYCSFNINLEAGQYYLKFTVVSYTGSRGVRLQYEDGTLVDTLTSSGLVTLTKKATTVLLYCGSGSSATSVYEDICINKSDSLDGTFTPYHAPSTLSLSFTGKSAGSVSEMYYPETGEKTKPLKAYTITGNETWGRSGTVTSGQYCVYFNVDGIKPVAVSAVANLLCTEYVPVSANNTYSCVVGISARDGAEGFRVYDPNIQTVDAMKAKMVGKTIYFEPATPSADTYVTPILDNTLLTESGGRMATVQTGTVVDGSYDMGFINL